MITMVTLPGETIDQVCLRAYGIERGRVEAVLDANPGLASRPLRLPAGVVIIMPVVPQADPVDQVIHLWD